MTAVDTTTRLTDAQRTFVAVGLARQHELPIVTAVSYTETFAELLTRLPEHKIRRCACGCGVRVVPLQHWASPACFRADEGRDYGEVDLDD